MSENPRTFIEAYVESEVQGEAAIAAGADRLELCGPGEGGLTPDPVVLGWLAQRKRLSVHAMLRPRAGDFVYDAAEFDEMRRGIPRLRKRGAQGVVFGILLPDGRLDVARMGELVALAEGMRVVCHRAFDATPDADAALDALIEMGVHEVLTSGQAPTALEGAATLGRLHERAGGRIAILAGGGIRPHNARDVTARSGVRRVHARATDAAVIRGIRSALND